MATKKVYPFIHVGSFVNGEEVMIDAREVCFYYPAPSAKKADGTPIAYVVGLRSGKELTLRADVDQRVYSGENLATLIDSVLYSHFWHDNEDSTPDEDEV